MLVWTLLPDRLLLLKNPPTSLLLVLVVVLMSPLRHLRVPLPRLLGTLAALHPVLSLLALPYMQVRTLIRLMMLAKLPLVLTGSRTMTGVVFSPLPTALMEQQKPVFSPLTPPTK